MKAGRDAAGGGVSPGLHKPGAARVRKAGETASKPSEPRSGETVYPFRPRGKAPSLPALAGHKEGEARKAQPIERARAREWRSCRLSMPFSGVGNRLRIRCQAVIH